MPIRFTHIVNPFTGANSPDEQQLRDITFRAIERAAGRANRHVSVTLATAQFPEDRAIIPDVFTPTSDLTAALNQLESMKHERKLPYMQDIISKCDEFPDTDFYIYSNMDIVLAPEFYNSVTELIEAHKCDALIINRRRVEQKWKDHPDHIHEQIGLPHPGYDCFVFSKDLCNAFEFGKAVIGVPGVGFLFAHNLFLFAKKCIVFADLKITFHLGMELIKYWAKPNVVSFQKSEVKKFLHTHRTEFDIRKFPGYHLPFMKRHYLWLMNPLFYYPLMFALDMKRIMDGRVIIDDALHGARLMDWKRCD